MVYCDSDGVLIIAMVYCDSDIAYGETSGGDYITIRERS